MDEVIYKARKFTLVRRAREVGGRIIWGEYLVHPGAVAVLALTGGKAVLVRQFRPALKSWTIEIPAGTLDGGESPEEAAVREMIEETGYKPLRLTPLLDFYPSPGISNELIRIFYADELEYVGIGRRDPGEIDMEVLLKEPGEVLRAIISGEVKDSKTIIAFLAAKEKGLL
ncbi:NUDIX hydrolase [Pyrobaculum aerophilum]|uniref:MutT homolog n=2 Tax=Pyrobaculum aerophilum TaxID=13773 RepID=O93722_9CREN|nr:MULTISPECIES: NUDIX hydrolase [Pyrobaculum]AAD00531.1 MutT homolog [Pyrobaculum aerophilum str. IM2]AAL62865.1 ADP ribose hydrolase, putative (mutT/nudix family protein) [Pyrobaculum aerophilum str. IM2]MCX8135937.1 NUDIX hydrolase [Pyrobaculum aerophilum]HII46287.1 NUDIX hydrolase [Pyrobaculum aerophilum]